MSYQGVRPATFKQPNITPFIHKGKPAYFLEQDYSFEWKGSDLLWRINIAKGFIYDGISVKRWLWSLTGVTPDGLGRAAALVHDFLYRYEGKLPLGSFQYRVSLEDAWIDCVDIDNPDRYNWTREKADKLFASLLILAGVSDFTRKMMYLGVRSAGWLYWNKKDL